jgi:hypothetical protein
MRMVTTFRQFVRRMLSRLLFQNGYQLCTLKEFPTKATVKEQVEALIRRLHPIAIDRELIRLGPQGDGGYLVPDDLGGIQACFSPGVNTVSGFENDCAKLGMAVFLADHSVDGPAASHPLFHFSKKYVGVTTDDKFMTLDNWVSSAGLRKDEDLLLQIDIEGFEYEVFLAASDELMKKFRIIVAEFHSLDQLWNRPFFGLASRVFDKILQTHCCVHIHPNNCCGVSAMDGIEIPRTMEFTFLRSDRCKKGASQSKFPHPLDFDNTENAPLSLPRNWYR